MSVFNLGPLRLTTTLTTNIMNPQAVTYTASTPITGQTYIVLTHIRIINTTANLASFSLWRGATGANAAGTEVIGTGKQIAGNGFFDWRGEMRFDVTDFLVGGSNTANALTIQADGLMGYA